MKEVVIKKQKNFDNFQLFLQKFIVHNLSAPCTQGDPSFMENYAHPIPSLMEGNQGVV